MAVFKLYHWSDNHNDSTVSAATIVSYQSMDDLDAVIHTGDIVNDDFSESIANSSPYDFLFTVGNHDDITAAGTQSTPYDWTLQPTQTQLYTKFMIPTVVADDDVVIEENKTYWYKDFDEKKVTIIGLNCCLRNSSEGADQRQFLADKLQWCKLNDYGVFVAMHITPYNAPLLVCNYTCKGMVQDGGFACSEDITWQTTSPILYPEIQRIYNVLISWADQVKILGLLTGHYHGDGIGKSGATTDYPNGNTPFPIICVGSTRVDNTWNDLIRISSQTVANLYVYDSDADSLIVYRIGASCRVDCSIRCLAVWNYKTHDWVQFLSR